MEHTQADDSVIIKFEQPAEQTIRGITRISGFVKARNFVPIIDALDLEANPRSSKVGPVTAAIRESIIDTPDEFPFKTKGILLGAADYERLERGRFRVVFADTETEGILDGGHNTLAIGLHVLGMTGIPEAQLRKVKLWADFRDLWNENRGVVASTRSAASEPRKDHATDDLDFLIPVELIVPEDVDDPGIVEAFSASLLEICAARNNNVQLKAEAKANQHGYYDDLRALLPAELAGRVEWKTNDGGAIKVADLLALAWIPLGLLDPMPRDEDGRTVEPPLPQNIYRSKGDCVTRFERLMSSADVTGEIPGVYRRELSSRQVKSALEIASEMPALYDHIYATFPKIYNEQGGKYGRIIAVAKLNAGKRSKVTKYFGAKVDYNSPEGFIVPLVYGLKALMETTDEGTVRWRTPPYPFLERSLPAVVKQFKLLLAPLQYDPQKVGKAPETYELAYNAFETEYLRLVSKEAHR
ncbi:hypothetical protein [Agromyces sp. Marseille-P2726]|uniref:hypothetical protein n=1 Tax=Agromyces sp. Marseille-P2726 TaxID=2709132 RepID=UPI00156E53FD|nr:hypothetical protein [Agromyces sp. Marseille-P2726]